jgi:hypothetical protein
MIEKTVEAAKIQYGVTVPLRAITATGKVSTFVAVRVSAKKTSFQPKMTQNMPATVSPGLDSGKIVLKKA